MSRGRGRGRGRRRGPAVFLGAMTVGVVLSYLGQLWALRRGLFAVGREAASESDKPASWPHVTIVVPARNERRNIRRCAITLLAQDYPSFDVVVVDDNSTDGTGAILAELRHGPHGEKLAVVNAGELPPGWAGKHHAMAAGAAIARGEWLLFTDADTAHRPGALRFAMREALRRDADLASLLPALEMIDWSNHTLMPLVIMGLITLYPPDRVANPATSTAIANGQYLLIRRATYDAVGGYAGDALRASVMDDRDMATLAKRQGGRIALLDGSDQVSVLMYRTFAEAWRGWGKNAYAGSKGGLPLFALMAIALPLGTVLPFVLWLAGVIARRRGVVAASSVQIAAIVAYRWALDGHLRHSRWWVLTHPVGGAILTGLLWRVLWGQITGRGVEWSGRRYLVAQDTTVAVRVPDKARTT